MGLYIVVELCWIAVHWGISYGSELSDGAADKCVGVMDGCCEDGMSDAVM
jgi:hypothetical protein